VVTEEGCVGSGAVSRRQALAILGGAGALVAEGLLLIPGTAAGKQAVSGYSPDGTAGRTAAFPLKQVRLLDGPFRANQSRNTDYLLFLDAERMLRSFRINYGQPTSAQPCGGWEAPDSEIRGHTTGHLLSGLALTYANTGNEAARAKGRYLVSQLAALQARAAGAGYHPGYMSAFPESYFDRMEAGLPVWSPYYMIHKYLAGMIDQYQLAGDGQALDVAVKLGDWVDWRTSRLPYAQMQMVLGYEYGGLPEALANLYAITGQERYLAAAQRFYDVAVFGPLAAGQDRLDGLQCNVTTPKIIACLRMWEETGEQAYRDIAVNFWDIVTRHHTYVIGGSGNFEHWHAPDVIAGQLSNRTCEGCVSYNMLKLTRLLHFHQPERTDLLDFYERTLFNMMLGIQDPDSPHGFNCYYTGLSPGAFKQQPMNYFPQGNPEVYSTDYGDFTCDHATGLETQAKFADTIYSRDARGVFVNLFIPSGLACADQGITLRQETGFPDDPATAIEVTAGAAAMTLRVRVPSWTAGPPRVRLNGAEIRDTGPAASRGGWVIIDRYRRQGDRLEVTLPMRLRFSPAPDQPSVQAVTYGPVVLAGAYGGSAATAMPHLDTASITMATRRPLTFRARADNRPVTLVPVARAHHQHYAVYWNTAPVSRAAPAPAAGRFRPG
jgi:uncharacterized protein